MVLTGSLKSCRRHPQPKEGVKNRDTCRPSCGDGLFLYPHHSADTQPSCVPSELPQIVNHLVSIQEIRLPLSESYQFRPMPGDLGTLVKKPFSPCALCTSCLRNPPKTTASTYPLAGMSAWLTPTPPPSWRANTDITRTSSLNPDPSLQAADDSPLGQWGI